MHFSNVHINYFTAWRYVTKEDTEYKQSEAHPDLSNDCEPPTMKTHQAIRKQRKRHAESRSVTSATSSATIGNVGITSNVEKTEAERAKKRQRLFPIRCFANNCRQKASWSNRVIGFCSRSEARGQDWLGRIRLQSGDKSYQRAHHKRLGHGECRISNAAKREIPHGNIKRSFRRRMHLPNARWLGELCVRDAAQQWHTSGAV